MNRRRAAASGDRGVTRQILGLAVPAFFALVAEPLFLLVDAAIVGHLGTPQLAGLGVAASVGDLIEAVTWTYPEKTVRILFFRCTVHGEPYPQERQEMRWVEVAELPHYPFPAADLQLVERLARTGLAS